MQWLHSMDHNRDQDATCMLETNYIFDQMLGFFFSWFILVRLLIKGRVYFVGKPVDSNDV